MFKYDKVKLEIDFFYSDFGVAFLKNSFVFFCIKIFRNHKNIRIYISYAIFWYVEKSNINLNQIFISNSYCQSHSLSKMIIRFFPLKGIIRMKVTKEFNDLILALPLPLPLP